MAVPVIDISGDRPQVVDEVGRACREIGFLTVVGGFLLAVPGFLTDILGLMLLLPVTRQWMHAALRRAFTDTRRPAASPGVVDLAPEEWRQVPDETIAHKPSRGRD